MNRSPFARSVVSSPNPKRRRERLGREARAHRVHELGPLDRVPQEVDPGRARSDEAVARREAELAEIGRGDPAVIGEVVDRQEGGGPADDRIGRAADRPGRAAPARCASRGRQDVDRRLAGRGVGPQRLEGGPAEDAEAPRVVGVVVEPGAVEGRRVVDEAEPVAVGLDREDTDRRDAARRQRIGHATTIDGWRPGRDRHAPIARQEHVHRAR